jgi:hypothetical protein
MASKKLTTISRIVSLQFNQISESELEQQNQTHYDHPRQFAAEVQAGCDRLKHMNAGRSESL